MGKEDEAFKTDARLVEECLQGDENAWSALIDRYKNLIYSIAVRHDLDRDDAIDVFQSVVTDVLSQLSSLREPQALQAWLIRITAHKCLQHKRRREREVRPEAWDAEAAPDDHVLLSEDLLHKLQSEQILRQALEAISPRCRRLIEMLFYETPARPYREVAATLGLATGSIGFTRRKCLECLRDLLRDAGFE